MFWGDFTGNNWEPQANFLQCSGGLSIGEWCSIARDTCCAVCPMPPITGPATTIVWTLGTFLNLVFVLMLTQEAPYNLALQVVGTDGAFIGLLFRPGKQGGGLSAFHYYYVPLYVVSCVPIAIGASLTSVAAMSGAGGGDAVHHGLLFGSHQKYIEHPDGKTSRGYLVKPKTKEHKKLVNKKDGRPVYAHHGPGTPMDGVSHAPLSRPWLPRVVCGMWAFHTIAWIGVFFRTYFADITFTQENCNEEFSLTTSWRLGMMTFALTFVAIAILFFIPLAWSLRTRYSSLMNIARVFHAQDFVWTHQTLCRCFIAGVLFAGWACGFVFFHIKALQTFLLLGDDPFDFGQINWLVSSMLISLVILRSWLDYRDATKRKHVSLIEDAQRRADHDEANPLRNHGHGASSTLSRHRSVHSSVRDSSRSRSQRSSRQAGSMSIRDDDTSAPPSRNSTIRSSRSVRSTGRAPPQHPPQRNLDFVDPDGQDTGDWRSLHEGLDGTHSKAAQEFNEKHNIVGPR